MFTLPKFTSAREIQRNYRRLFDGVKKSKRPLIVMRNNKPEVAIIDIKKLDELEAVASVLRSLKQIKEGKAKLLTSLTNL
jgi:PHD/YefM family antitoxin component YafN of YafNO toxin-antitoxin module